MRRVRVFLMIGLLLLPGCADPVTDPLKPGENAIVFDPDGVNVLLSVPRRRKDGQTVLESVRVPIGTRVVVLDDAPAKSPVRSELRLVKVRVDEGEHRGVEGHLNRQELRSSD